VHLQESDCLPPVLPKRHGCPSETFTVVEGAVRRRDAIVTSNHTQTSTYS
jgi:hypothetical protein